MSQALNIKLLSRLSVCRAGQFIGHKNFRPPAGRQAMDEGLTYWIAATLGTIVAMLISWICLRQAELVLKVLGRNGMNAVTRIVGFLLVCIAAQMIITGAQGAFGWHAAPETAQGTVAVETHG